ncbi:hypothetical protein ISN44_As12g039560 [Arabidopsis suecica]|uniref:Uncharacterized protein n=1 Tax=Arabidopsis suecica TaxID=45249 RepID=A0A8T1YS54_ARASU|nr:hypothetical protein ISN44_As12g039560 [Arabidopsis suecica]
MVNEGNDSSSDNSYSGGFEFRRRKKPRHVEEAFKMQTIVISYKETEQAFEESTDKTKTEDELVSYNNLEIDNDLCVLKDVLEAVTSFQGLSQYQKNLMFQKLKNLGAETIKEFIDEWKALSVEELHLNIKKETLFAKFVKAGV